MKRYCLAICRVMSVDCGAAVTRGEREIERERHGRVNFAQVSSLNRVSMSLPSDRMNSESV